MTTIGGRRLNELGEDGRLICPNCRRSIRGAQKTVDDGMYLRHAECPLTRLPPDERTVRVHVRARDWHDTAWRENFEADLRRTGWRLLALEPPSAERPEYIYVLALLDRRRPAG